MSWLLPLAAGLGLALLSNAFTPVNTDLGWTLAFGRDLFRTGQFPSTNTQTFTEPNHPLVMYQWGFNVLLYALHSRWGAAGVIAAKWGWMVLTVVGLAAAIRAAASGALVRLLVLLASVHFMWMAFELVRAQLVSFALVALVVYAGLSGSRRALWCSAVLAGVSANFHGGFLAGWFLLAGLCGALALEALLKWTDTRLRLGELVALPLVAGLSALLNPYGPRLLVDTLALSKDPARLLDREWVPLWDVETLVPGEKVALVLLGLTVLLALVLLPRRRLRLWLLLALAVGTSLSASRHLRMAPILLAPVVAAALEAALARVRGKGLRLERLDALTPKLSGVLALGFLGLWAVQVPQALRFIEWPYGNPANAIAVMRLNGLSGNVWNDFDWGGLLLWAAPDSRVACDGRHVMAYSGDMIATNIGLGYNKLDPLAVVEHFKTDLVLLNANDPALPRLTSRFTPLYCDPNACLLSKRPEHLALLEAGLKLPSDLLFVSDYFQSPAGPDAALR
jgi:hypothetical protein